MKEIKIKNPWNLVKVKFQRKYPKYGYVFRREIFDTKFYGSPGTMEMTNYYSLMVWLES